MHFKVCVVLSNKFATYKQKEKNRILKLLQKIPVDSQNFANYFWVAFSTSYAAILMSGKPNPYYVTGTDWRNKYRKQFF